MWVMAMKSASGCGIARRFARSPALVMRTGNDRLSVDCVTDENVVLVRLDRLHAVAEGLFGRDLLTVDEASGHGGAGGHTSAPGGHPHEPASHQSPAHEATTHKTSAEKVGVAPKPRTAHGTHHEIWPTQPEGVEG